MSKDEALAREMARYILSGEPVPEDLAKRLIDELCDEYKEVQKGIKVKHGPGHMERY
jgi:hypothetical protein